MAEAARDLEVKLSREAFLYFNWALALERPILPFLLYTLTLLILVSFTGLWPAARAFVPAVFLPLIGYLIVVWLGARRLWARFPEREKTRRYRFLADAYVVNGRHRVAYREVARALESRRGIYLLREDGTADILPISVLDDALVALLKAKLEPVWKRSSFL